MKLWIAIVTMAFLAVSSVWAAGTPTDKQDAQKSEAAGNVRYKSGKDINFEQLIIQGQLKRPEITVVTGSTDQGSDGLLRLRENFLDHTAMAIGEELQ